MKRVLDENGVIKVQPDIVKDELLVLGSDFFFSLLVLSWVVICHNESDALTKFCRIRPLTGISKTR